MKQTTIKFTTKTDQPTERSTERHRYEEFVEQDPWELIDWERKMQQQRDEMREEEKDREERKERASNLEKSWELMRMCTQYIRENNKNWKDEGTQNRKRQEDLERKEERLTKIAERRGKIKATAIQRKITETILKIPETDRRTLQQEEEKKRKIELKHVKENMWKK